MVGLSLLRALAVQVKGRWEFVVFSWAFQRKNISEYKY